MGEIIITTTNAINGVEIDKYLGLVTSNLVIGTNIFSDFVASFSDFFGGMSGTYRNQLDVLYQRAIADLTSKAKKLRANAILGVKIDFDEISGQGKSMFMVSITGTAVRFASNVSNTAAEAVSLNILQEEMFLYKWEKRNVEDAIKTSDWDIILDNNLTQLASDLYQHYLIVRNYGDELSIHTVDKFLQFMSKLDYTDAVKIVYQDYVRHRKVANMLIKMYNLFSPAEVLNLLAENKLDCAIDLLKYDKKEYTNDDINLMRRIISEIENLPDIGKVESVKSGILSSKMEDKYVCQCGQKNPIDIEYCTNCSRDKKGLLASQNEIIKSFREKVSVLEHIVGRS